eukprot:scaffold13160_cov106-Isochrysis_galbana.AAC.3
MVERHVVHELRTLDGLGSGSGGGLGAGAGEGARVGGGCSCAGWERGGVDGLHKQGEPRWGTGTGGQRPGTPASQWCRAKRPAGSRDPHAGHGW